MLSKKELKYYSSLTKKKYREQEGKFLIEGYHLIEECLGSSYFMECVFISDNPERGHLSKIQSRVKLKKIPIYHVNESQFNKISDTQNSQGIAAVVNKKANTDVNSIYDSNLIIALDRLSDPGNLGTIIRTAYWFGVDSVLISENSVELYNSKVIRSTQGGLFHLNILENLNLETTLENLKSNGFEIFLLDAKADKELGEINGFRKVVLVFGNEAEGISKNVLKSGFDRIKITGYTDCESLNVAVSTGIVLHYFRNHISARGKSPELS